MTDNYRKIPLEPDKRHLVFGDIHGRHSTFVALLEQLDHDPAHDIVYSVGDLIDRGPDPVAVIDFFTQPHCHAIRGNHEQMVVGTDTWREIWLHPHNGGPSTLASLALHDRELDWLATFCRGLPIVLDVGEDDEPGAFRLVHAECPFDWSEQTLQDFLDGLSTEEAGESRLLWGRDDVERAMLHLRMPGNFDPPALDPARSTRPVFCGHTPLDDVLTVGGTSWIDTWAGGAMTCIEPATMRTHRQPLTTLDGG